MASVPRKSAFLRTIFPTGKVEVGAVTLSLLLGAAALSLYGRFGADLSFYQHFFITEVRPRNGGGIVWNSHLLEIRHGEIWRLFTPFFLHFRWSHLLGNAFWFVIFGTFIEKRRGIGTLLALVVCFEVISGGAQFLLRGPLFGGLSGVNSGLLGYVWMRGWLDPQSGLVISKLTLALPLVFIAAAVVGLQSQLGLVSHLTGLAAGMIWGVMSALIRKRSAVAAVQ